MKRHALRLLAAIVLAVIYVFLLEITHEALYRPDAGPLWRVAGYVPTFLPAVLFVLAFSAVEKKIDKGS